MKTVFITLAALMAAGFLALLSAGDVRADQMSDREGLVTFDMPSGWSNDRFNNGRTFTRKGLADDPNILAVVPERNDGYMTIEKMSEGRNNVHAAQEHRLIREKTYRLNGFEVWEAVHEAEIRSQDVVMHTYLMFSDTLMVDVHLNASKNVYKKLLPDLRKLAKSVREK